MVSIVKNGKKLCTFPKCTKVSSAQKLCNGHYEQLRLGKELSPLRNMRSKNSPPVIKYKKVLCRIHGLKGPCHEFIGTKSTSYKQVICNGKMVFVH